MTQIFNNKGINLISKDAGRSKIALHRIESSLFETMMLNWPGMQGYACSFNKTKIV